MERSGHQLDLAIMKRTRASDQLECLLLAQQTDRKSRFQSRASAPSSPILPEECSCRTLGSGGIIQRLDRHGYNVGRPPSRRDPNLMGRPLDTLRKHVADDRRNSAVAIDYGRSRSAVIDNKAIVAFKKFQECHAGEFPVISEPNEPSGHKLQVAGWICEGDDLLFR